MARRRSRRSTQEPTSPLSAPDADIMRRLDRLSYLLDNAVRVPGTSYRIGYDALIGLVPGVGDAVGLAFSAYIVLEAARIGAPRGVLGRMAANVAVEAVVGVIPLLGDVFDATWKANERNVYLLRRHLGIADAHRKPKRGVGWLMVGVLLLVVAALLYLAGLAIGALW